MIQLTAPNCGPFHLDLAGDTGLGNRLARLGLRAFERLLAFPALNEVHRKAATLNPRVPFADRAVESLGVQFEVPATDLAQIPATGPLVVVANHPFGGLDGLMLLALLRRVRPDVKIMANHLLRTIPEMREMTFFVDPYDGPGSAALNLGSMRSALRFVKEGGALAIFPAGEVSGLDRQTGEIADIGWSPAVARFIRASAASVLPVFFAGRNSMLFQWAGLIHPRLRTVLLPRELLKQRGRRLSISIGQAIAPARIRQFDSDEELAAYLRVRTYVLSGRTHKTHRVESTRRRPERVLDPIAAEESADRVASEIAALPADQHLAASGVLQVVFAQAAQLDATLREIGRLREITFRKAGEGSGKSRDLDQFDPHYLHLLVWNTERKQIVGAYRLGLTDQIVQLQGKAGLYTSTLFDFKDELLHQISPAIELGRSFVRPEYQKEYAPLMLLWRGIATFVARNPRYRRLFGPVSISNDYQSLSRQIMMKFLERNTAAPSMSQWVRPKNPPRLLTGRHPASRLAAVVVRSVEAVDDLLGEIESGRTGMPVLLRQYLKLNAKLLGFNVDPEFGDVLDGLMLVDLLEVERAVLTRYMGKEGIASFYEHHGRGNSPRQPAESAHRRPEFASGHVTSVQSAASEVGGIQ